MCNKHSMAYWLDDVRPETAFLNGSVIDELKFSFSGGEVKTMVKRTTPRGQHQVAFLQTYSVRAALRLVWKEANGGSSGVIWRHDRYHS